MLAVLGWGSDLPAALHVESVSLNGKGGTVHATPGSTLELQLRFTLTEPPFCPGCPVQVILALDAIPLKCLYDDVPVSPPEPLNVETTFQLPPDESGYFTLYAVFEEEDDCEQALERYRQIGTRDPDRPRTAIGAIVVARGTVEIQLSKHVFEPGETVEGQVVGIPSIEANVLNELTVFDASKPQDPGATVATFTTGAGEDKRPGESLSLNFSFVAPAQPVVLDFHASFKAGDAVLATGHARAGVRGPELRAAPLDILAGQVAQLNAPGILGSLQSSSAGGIPVEVQLGTHRRVVKVTEQQIFADPGRIPPELLNVRTFLGVATDDAGTELPGSVATFSADPVANLVSASIREIEDPDAPVKTQRTLWVESMEQYDQGLPPGSGAHLVYELSNTLPPAEVGAGHSEPLVQGGARLQPGDVNVDGKVDISDPVNFLGFLFLGAELDHCYVDHDSRAATPTGRAVLDWNGDGGYDISDAVGALTYLFSAGAPHALGNACRPFPDSACLPTCGQGGGHQEHEHEHEQGGGAATASVYVPVALYEHFDNYLTSWRRYNIFLSWRATVLNEFRSIPRRDWPYEAVTVADVQLWAWSYVGRDGYASDCSSVLSKFRNENQTPYKALHMLFTNHGYGSCGGMAYLATSTDYLHSIVIQSPWISEAYETMVLSQETGHNLDFHRGGLPHDSHLNGGISESWWVDYGWWIFSNWQLHCTAMMGSYGGCNRPEIRYHNSSIEPLRHLAEGFYQHFRP